MAPLRSSSTSFDDPLLVDLDDPSLDHQRDRRRPLLDGFERAVDRAPWWPSSPGRAIGALVALVALALVGWWFLRPAPAPVETSLPLASTSGAAPGASSPGAGAAAAGTTTTAPADLVVQAAGAVTKPGVYTLPATARVDDLIRSAGGLRNDADGDRVNLAAPLADGARVWIPARGEAEPPEVVAGGGAPSVASGGSGDGTAAAGTTPQVVDLNQATAADLDTLPGVGPSTAAAILAYRQEHGSFSTVDDLLEVRGIGDAKLEQIRPLARV